MATSAPKPDRMLRQYELVDRVTSYDTSADEGLINRAYVYTVSKHGKQKRHNGDPYFSHPIEVAGILTGFRVDTPTIVTALLHDTIEDTDATVEELAESFGPEVAELVDGVTKLGKIEFTSEHSKQAENLRKFMLAMSKDIRVLMVKLADRLHNMRTLHFVPKPEKRRRIAQETLDIYAPLAGRMGIQSIKEELEDLSFQHLYPEARAALLEKLEAFRATSGDVIAEITEELEAAFAAEGIACKVYGREKRPYSMWVKMQRRKITLEQLSDIFGFRVIVEDVSDCYRVLGALHTRWAMVPGRFKDYLSTPKQNGYRSIHSTVIGPARKRVEVQIRTETMHELAEYGIAAHWIYKEGIRNAGASEEFADAFRWLKQLDEILETGKDDPEGFLENTKLQMYVDQVFCFTPKGMLITLPSGATALDFAYAVHTRIGDTCVGCKVNGRHVPLRTELKNGDEVEIVRSEAQRPTAAWETLVKTGKARAAIRRSIRQEREVEMTRVGRQLLHDAFAAVGKEPTDTVLERVFARFEYNTVDELCLAVGDGRVNANDVLRKVHPKLAEAVTLEEPSERRRPRESEEGLEKSAVRLSGASRGQAIQFAPATFPLPGERVVGIAEPGKGVVVYPIDSLSLGQYDEHPDYWIDVRWDVNEEDPPVFPCRFRVTLVNEVGALHLVTDVIADYDSNISNLELTRRDLDFYDLEIDLQVRDLRHATDIKIALEGLHVVNSVERPRA